MKFIDNSFQDKKADLQRAINKWRRGPIQLEIELWKLPIDTIIDLAKKSSDQVAICKNQLTENQSIQNHLLNQRDEFLNYYVKSQILALALIKDRDKFVQMQAISRWCWRNHFDKKTEILATLRDVSYLIQDLKKQKDKITIINNQLSKENEELGQFAGDGSVIKQNMEKIKMDRDKLAEKLKSTDQDLVDLLDEKARLEKEVQETELRAKLKPNPVFAKYIDPENDIQQETEVEKAKRLRFERLEAMVSNQGEIR